MTSRSKGQGNSTLHDNLFKVSLSDPKITKEFFETYLPEEIKQLIDLNSLKAEKESFIDNELV